MAFRLDPDRGLRRQVRTLLDGEHAAAVRAARRMDAAAVHAIRLHGKRSRALLRLVRGALRKRDFRRLNHAWRDIGRLLAPVRDRTVLADCLARLGRRYAERLVHPPEPVAPLPPGERARILALVRAQLERLGPRLRTLACSRRWRHVIEGHVRTLAACAAAHARAADGARAGARHEWRKRVKDARFQMHLLAPLAAGVATHLEAAWDRLGAALGREQDVVAVSRWLARRRGRWAADYHRAAQEWLAHLRTRTRGVAAGLPPDPRSLKRALAVSRRTW